MANSRVKQSCYMAIALLFVVLIVAFVLYEEANRRKQRKQRRPQYVPLRDYIDMERDTWKWSRRDD